MFEHIDSLNFLLSNERIRLSLAKSESEIAIRSGWVKQLEKEIEGEKKFITENAISDDDLLSELDINYEPPTISRSASSTCRH